MNTNRFLGLEKELLNFDVKTQTKNHSKKRLSKGNSIFSTQKSVVVAAGIGWKVYNILKDGSGLKTELIKMDGAYYPEDEKNKPHNEHEWRSKSQEVYEKHMDGLILKDEISAKFNLRFEYNGFTVGNIDITEKANNLGEVGGWKLEVKTAFRPSLNKFTSNNSGQRMLMIEITFTYKWHTVKPFEDDTIKTVRYSLYGDGTVIKN